MLLKNIDHITINVINLAKSVKFYENVFGLTKIGFVNMNDHTLTYMGLPGECRLELIEYLFEHQVVKNWETNAGIYRHIAFMVDNLDNMKKRCDDYQVKIKLQPTLIRNLNCSAMLIEDPNGVEIELVEKA